MKKMLIAVMAAMLTACNVSPVKVSRACDHKSRENVQLKTSMEKMTISRIAHVIDLSDSYDYYEYFAYSESLETEICIGSDMLPGEYKIGETIIYDHIMTTTIKAGK